MSIAKSLLAPALFFVVINSYTPCVMADNPHGDTETSSLTFNLPQQTNNLYADMQVNKLFGSPKPRWFWAYQGNFINGGTFYFGLQPNGEYGKTALFSIFGKGTKGLVANCKEGADSTDADTGTSCHIHYDWRVGHRYTFNIKNNLTSWKGVITDTGTGQETVIGEISVPKNWNFIDKTLIGWSEWLAGASACTQRTYFQTEYSGVNAKVDGKNYKATASTKKDNTCATYFVSNDRLVAVIDSGSAKSYFVQFNPGPNRETIIQDVLTDTKDELDLNLQEATAIVDKAESAGINVVEGLSQAIAEKLKSDFLSHGAKQVMIGG